MAFFDYVYVDDFGTLGLIFLVTGTLLRDLLKQGLTKWLLRVEKLFFLRSVKQLYPTLVRLEPGLVDSV